jgi:hypothetical protein
MAAQLPNHHPELTAPNGQTGREHRAAVAARLRLGECRVTETLGSRDAGKGAIPANGRASASYCSAALTVCTILNFLLMSCNKATTSYFLGWL